MPNDKTLWDRLQAFEPDQADAAFRFSDRLARENGWSRDFARGAINEYKRFVYLAVTSPTQVTPSDIVDQVWHLHLTFTRSYWDEMCTQVLGRPLHHGPTKGGKAEDRRYRNQYAETLAFYRQTFGEEPPPPTGRPSRSASRAGCTSNGSTGARTSCCRAHRSSWARSRPSPRPALQPLLAQPLRRSRRLAPTSKPMPFPEASHLR